MAYKNNNDRPTAVKYPLTPEWILAIQAVAGKGNKWSNDELAMIWQMQPAGMDLNDFMRMMNISFKRDLDPILRQIYASVRWSNRDNKYVSTIESTIDGFRLMCDRTGQVDGITAPVYEYGTDTEGNRFLVSCEISLFRKGCSKPFTARVHLSEYNSPNDMWAKMPHNMLEKCCEAKVRRMTFAEALSGIYIREEMMQAEEPMPPAYAPKVQTSVEPPSPAPVATAPAPEMYQPEQPAEKSAEDKYICADTGKPIVDYMAPDNKLWTAEMVYEHSKKTHRRPLCADRMIELHEEKSKQAAEANSQAAMAAAILDGKTPNRVNGAV